MLLSLAKMQRCPRDCSAVDAHRMMLTVRSNALDTDAHKTRLQQAVGERLPRSVTGHSPIQSRSD